MPYRLGFTLCLLLSLVACSTSPAPHFAGEWGGTATTQLESTELVVHIAHSDNVLRAYITLPDVGVARWPATSLHGDEKSLEISIPSDSGKQAIALQLLDGVLLGEWQEARFEELAKVRLARREAVSTYSEQRLSIEGPAGLLGASFFSPSTHDGCPAVVFLHGSGPQPRDASRFHAIKLAENGIASVIFDKRGVAESEGSYVGASFQDLAADGIAVAEFLHDMPQISRIGFYGHSQGGWIAPLAASMWPHSAFVITSSGPAVTPSREAQWEVVRAMRKAGSEERDVEQARDIIELWHHGIRSGNWLEFDEAVTEVKDSTWYRRVAQYRRRPDRDFIRAYQAYMDYDPIPALSALSVPMLAILAPDDESIDAMETAAILGKLADQGQDIRVTLYPGYDHSLRKLGEDGNFLRWPPQPVNLYDLQVRFIQETN